MKRKNPALVMLQMAWPWAGISLIVNSIVLAWAGTPAQVAAWAGLLPVLSGIVTLMGALAGGGPLVADQIKAKAGVLNLPPGGS